MRTPLCRSVRSHTFRLSSWIRCQNTGEGVRFLDSHWYTRTGRLDVHFSEQSVFGRPRKVASRAAAERFIRTHYRRFAGQAPCPAPLPSVPPDYDVRLKILRSEFELSQPALARLIGAAGKAVRRCARMLLRQTHEFARHVDHRDRRRVMISM